MGCRQLLCPPNFLHFPLVSFFLFQDPIEDSMPHVPGLSPWDPLGCGSLFFGNLFLCYLKKVEKIVESEEQAIQRDLLHITSVFPQWDHFAKRRLEYYNEVVNIDTIL